MELQDWQERLDRHFTGLRERRRAEAPNQPIFGLEHGLGNHDISDLAEAIRSHVTSWAPCWEHRLAWIVYASEFGYLYAGDEYWHTFEGKTPGWTRYGDRHWISRCFRSFHQHYGGGKPSGRWARHFSIICWPITHAILPYDLQRHLVRVMYELRYAITPRILSEPLRLGKLIAGRSLGTSARFQQLTQEPLFIGQIAAALLQHDEKIAASLIYPSALSRIGRDLDRERRSRSWLRDTRKKIKERVRYERILPRGIRPEGAERDVEEPAPLPQLCGVEPHLFLRPSDEGAWDLLLQIPHLSPIADRSPQVREVLLNSDCRVAGSSGHLLARGRLLHSSARILLRDWPSRDQPLLEFDPSTPDLDSMLRTECFLHPDTVSLFRIATDRLAQQLTTRTVRAGEEYILLFEDGAKIETHSALVPTKVGCNGIQARLLNMPQATTPDLLRVLQKMRIRQAGTLRMWPSGLAPARWDGEGAAEWLSTDAPCIGLCVDHDVDVFRLVLDSEVLKVPSEGPGAPIFVELPGLSPGSYTLSVSIIGGSEEVFPEHAVLDIMVREPRTPILEMGSQGPLRVIVDPSTPTLEEIWEDHAKIEIYGPSSRQVECEVSLHRRGQSEPLFSKSLAPLLPPVSGDLWRRHFHCHFRKGDEVKNAYDFADFCVLQLHAQELGAFTLTAERAFTPLRWVIRWQKHKRLLRLLDDTGSEARPEMLFYTFENPDIERPIGAQDLSARGGCVAEKGLYVARVGDHDCAIVVSPGVIHELDNLRITPQFVLRKRRADDTVQLVKLLSLWASARAPGDLLASTWRHQVLLGFLQQVFGLIAGARWEQAEREIIGRPKDEALRRIRTVISRKTNEASLAAELIARTTELRSLEARRRARLLGNLGGHLLGSQIPLDDQRRSACGPRDPIWLSEFVLRLATCSGGVSHWAGNALSEGVARLLEAPGLARLARFMVIMLAHEQELGVSGFGPMYKEWYWR